MYQVVSAFGDVDDASSILETAAKSAAAGNATTTDSVNLLSAVTKGYGDISAEAVQRRQICPSLLYRPPRTNQLPELASSIGKVVPWPPPWACNKKNCMAPLQPLTGVTSKAPQRVATQYKSVPFRPYVAIQEHGCRPW
ncbi:MAG: hypothetical protein ACLTGJ_02495 [Faecalibacterium prausnitzii]